jgi:hypothetical protein
LLAVVVLATVAIVLLFGFTTVRSLYKGTAAGWFGPPERPVVAEVGTCRRLGPVSVDGFGYWWKCQVTVRAADGRVVRASVDRSIMTPADRGRPVELREACEGGGATGCSYGRPVARGWKVAVGALVFIQWCVLAFIGFAVVMVLIRATLGRRGYVAFYDRMSRTRASSPRPGRSDDGR